MQKKLSVVILVLLLLIGIFLWFGKGEEGLVGIGKEKPSSSFAIVVVTMSDDGFSPSSFSVHKGDRVDFKNISTSTYHWPASDLHQTHELYPEFDPKKPIPPGETWSFVFDRVGAWRFHDHLHSSKRGTLTVTSVESK